MINPSYKNGNWNVDADALSRVFDWLDQKQKKKRNGLIRYCNIISDYTPVDLLIFSIRSISVIIVLNV